MKGLKGMRTDLGTQRDEQLGMVNDANDPFTRTASGDWEDYRNLAGQDNSQFNYDPFQEYNPEDAQKFLDPSTDYQIGEATKAIQGTQANAGKLHSGATLKAISDRAQGIASTGYQNAQQQAYQNWLQNINLSRGAKDQGANLAQQRLGNAQGLANQGYNATQNALQQGMNVQQGYNQNLNDLNTNLIGLQGQKKSIGGFGQQFGQALPGLIQAGGQIAGMVK
jgi:hypothetical protein